MNKLLFYLCTVLLLSCSQSQAGETAAAARVEGEAGLLDLLRDVQASNNVRYRTGSMSARVSERERGTERVTAVERNADVRFVWDGERRYWQFSRSTKYTLTDAENSVEEPVGVSHLIERPDAYYLYNADNGFADQLPTRRVMDSLLVLDPARCWYRFERTTRSWEWMLDPESTAELVEKFDVRRAPDGRVIIDRHTKNGTLLQIEASLEEGGNIVKYTAYAAADTRGEVLREGTYRWQPDGLGGWALEEMHLHRFSDSEAPIWEYHLEVLGFDPQPEIASDRFEFSSLPLAEGTRVSVFDEDGEKVRTWTHGTADGTERPLSEDVLERLSDRLREEGFASPEDDR